MIQELRQQNSRIYSNNINSPEYKELVKKQERHLTRVIDLLERTEILLKRIEDCFEEGKNGYIELASESLQSAYLECRNLSTEIYNASEYLAEEYETYILDKATLAKKVYPTEILKLDQNLEVIPQVNLIDRGHTDHMDPRDHKGHRDYKNLIVPMNGYYCQIKGVLPKRGNLKLRHYYHSDLRNDLRQAVRAACEQLENPTKIEEGYIVFVFHQDISAGERYIRDCDNIDTKVIIDELTKTLFVYGDSNNHVRIIQISKADTENYTNIYVVPKEKEGILFDKIMQEKNFFNP